MFAVEDGLYCMRTSRGKKPTIRLGNGIGEVVAAVCSGVLELEYALNILGGTEIEAGRVKGSTVGLICPRTEKFQTAPSSGRNFLSSFAEKSEDVSAELRMMAQCGARVTIKLGSADSPIFSTFSKLLLSDARFRKLQHMPALDDSTDD